MVYFWIWITRNESNKYVIKALVRGLQKQNVRLIFNYGFNLFVGINLVFNSLLNTVKPSSGKNYQISKNARRMSNWF